MESSCGYGFACHVKLVLATVFYLHIIEVLRGCFTPIFKHCFTPMFTRLSVAVFIGNKNPETIIKCFLENWCLSFGFPKKILTDNGGEFNNQHFRSMAENYGCEVKCTAAFAPWSNGIVERRNAVVTEMFEKLRADHDFSAFRDATLLKFACFAKNVLYNKDGFAPFQLVFGSNARLPTVFRDQAPALECRTTTEVISRQLSLLHASRKAFLVADCSSE